LSKNSTTSSVATMTVITVPISRAWTTARSPLSAKNSMKTKITAAIANSTSQSGPGMTPSAPWMRLLRAASRSDVSSSHLPYAACSVALFGSVVLSVLNSVAAHGLIASPSVPSSIRGHSPWTTDRP
jgi:hypothetical protein